MGGSGGGRCGDVNFRGRPLQSHTKEISDVPCSGYGQPQLETDVGRDTRKNRTDTDTDEHFRCVPVGHLKRFFEVLFLKVLLQHTRVQVVVHLVIKPRQRARLNGFQALGGDWLPVR